MLFESDKVMFEIYRETEYTGQYRVCYFTELQDHNKETEINHALAGEHFFDGFIKNFGKDEAKEIISSLLGRLNNGERIDPQDVEARARRPTWPDFANHPLPLPFRGAILWMYRRLHRLAHRRAECRRERTSTVGRPIQRFGLRV